MKLARFKKLIHSRRFGQSQSNLKTDRTRRALQYHLVNKLPVRQAAARAGNVTPSAVYQALGTLGKLPHQLRKTKPRRCPECGRLLLRNRRTKRSSSASR